MPYPVSNCTVGYPYFISTLLRDGKPSISKKGRKKNERVTSQTRQRHGNDSNQEAEKKHVPSPQAIKEVLSPGRTKKALGTRASRLQNVRVRRQTPPHRLRGGGQGAGRVRVRRRPRLLQRRIREHQRKPIATIKTIATIATTPPQKKKNSPTVCIFPKKSVPLYRFCNNSYHNDSRRGRLRTRTSPHTNTSVANQIYVSL